MYYRYRLWNGSVESLLDRIPSIKIKDGVAEYTVNSTSLDDGFIIVKAHFTVNSVSHKVESAVKLSCKNCILCSVHTHVDNYRVFPYFTHWRSYELVSECSEDILSSKVHLNVQSRQSKCFLPCFMVKLERSVICATCSMHSNGSRNSKVFNLDSSFSLQTLLLHHMCLWENSHCGYTCSYTIIVGMHTLQCS